MKTDLPSFLLPSVLLCFDMHSLKSELAVRQEKSKASTDMFEEELGAYYRSNYSGLQGSTGSWRIMYIGWMCEASEWIKMSEKHKRKETNVKLVKVIPSEIVEPTEDRGMCRLLALLAADHPALPTLLQVGSNFWTRVILQERLPCLLQLLHLPPVLQNGAGNPIWEEFPSLSHEINKGLIITLVSKT